MLEDGYFAPARDQSIIRSFRSASTFRNAGSVAFHKTVVHYSVILGLKIPSRRVNRSIGANGERKASGTAAQAVGHPEGLNRARLFCFGANRKSVEGEEVVLVLQSCIEWRPARSWQRSAGWPVSEAAKRRSITQALKPILHELHYHTAWLAYVVSNRRILLVS